MPKTRAETWKVEAASKAELRRVFSLISAWQCPNCGWFRARTNRESWERKIIEHPMYGFASNYTAYEKDIRNHDCKAYVDAKTRCVSRWGTN